MTGPLRDLLVVDLARVLSGPFAAMLLGDLGARVVKVERPGDGDDTRSWGPPFVRGQSTYFMSINRNKESLELDLKDPGDIEVLHELLRRADVVIENFRPGVMERLGLGHRALLALNPALVIVSITGFGHDGPESSRSGYDQIVQGEAGIMSMTGNGPGEPVKVGVPIGDVQAGMFAALGALAGLHERTRTGKGGVVRTSLLAALVSTHVFQGTRQLLAGETPEPSGNRHPTVVPYGAYDCRDGMIQIAVGSDGLWRRFAPLVGVDPDDPRFASNADRAAFREELDALIVPAFATEYTDVWLARLAEAGIPAGEIKPLDRVYASEQVRSQGLVVQVEHPEIGVVPLPGPALRFDSFPGLRHRPPPLLGEHSSALRRWLATGGEAGAGPDRAGEPA
ncbi:CaiB/BaiF CoA transferase family protein [Rhizohabitans arisaemae]|uniref:CaiB/BaiF CoA transferase family protein n=1 Tax=Rhizohabitans arisaemae TaxID=2720610 RepID=UPI0024B069DA|nr:CoA transferase [Rhizohabitans arisaemae]